MMATTPKMRFLTHESAYVRSRICRIQILTSEIEIDNFVSVIFQVQVGIFWRLYTQTPIKEYIIHPMYGIRYHDSLNVKRFKNIRII